MRTEAKTKQYNNEQEQFRQLLEWLDPDPRRAAELYRDVHRRLILYYAARNCAEAEDLADQTMDRVMRKIGPEEIDHGGEPIRYFYGFARNIHLEYKRTRNLHLNEDFLRAADEQHSDPADVDENARLRQHLDKCLSGLKTSDRKLLLEYYAAETGREKKYREKIAKKYDLTPNSMRVKVFRLKKELENCLLKRRSR